MSEILEICMLILFGLSWPMNVIKSYKVRTTKGKSLAFLFCIFTGYVCGIAAKLVSGGFKWYVLFFYILNIVMVTADLVLYFRNLMYDKEN